MPVHHRFAPALSLCAPAVAIVLMCLPAAAQAQQARSAQQLSQLPGPSDSAGSAWRRADAITVCLLPLGKHDQRLMDSAAAGIRYLYGFSVTVLPARDMPASAYYEPRKRYRADTLLDYIVDEVAPEHDCFAVVGFTSHDISVTKGKHHDWGVLGLGFLGGPAAVVSTYRMRRGAGLRTQAMRAVKVVNHELGHVLGLDHHDYEADCLMNDGQGTIKTVDREKGLLCADSRADIQAAHNITLPRRERFDWSQVLAR
jgi:archaemetzincin